MTDRQLVKYSFFKLDEAFLRLRVDTQREAKLEFVDTIRNFNRRMLLRPYSLMGARGDVDFLLWQIANELEPIRELATAIRRTKLGAYLTMPRSFLSGTKQSIYDIVLPNDDKDVDNRESIIVEVSDLPYLFVYPFTKTRPWYALTGEERQEMIFEHIKVGREFPDITVNTSYSYGVDDQEFIVAFEGDNPHDFIDLVQKLRFTEASMYTLQDTPMHICTAMPLADVIDSIGGPPVAHMVEKDITEVGGWLEVAQAGEVPVGHNKLVYYGREQVGVFNVEGTLYALNNRCPHSRGPLHQGKIVESEGQLAVRCPWHVADFALETGAVLCGPSPRDVETFSIKEEDGYIYIARTATLEATPEAAEVSAK